MREKNEPDEVSTSDGPSDGSLLVLVVDSLTGEADRRQKSERISCWCFFFIGECDEETH